MEKIVKKMTMTYEEYMAKYRRRKYRRRRRRGGILCCEQPPPPFPVCVCGGWGGGYKGMFVSVCQSIISVELVQKTRIPLIFVYFLKKRAGYISCDSFLINTQLRFEKRDGFNMCPYSGGLTLYYSTVYRKVLPLFSIWLFSRRFQLYHHLQE